MAKKVFVKHLYIRFENMVKHPLPFSTLFTLKTYWAVGCLSNFFLFFIKVNNNFSKNECLNSIIKFYNVPISHAFRIII